MLVAIYIPGSLVGGIWADVLYTLPPPSPNHERSPGDYQISLIICTQVFPGDLLEHNYPAPNNPRQLLGRSEVDRRGNYVERLEKKLQESAGYPLVGVVKQCLDNIPEERPTAEQLVRVLEGLKGDIEGPCGKLATVDAVRQVKTAMALSEKSKEKVNELAAKEEEIQQLQQQLEVQCILYVLVH